MEINRIIFPAPPCSYTSADLPDLIWIPNSSSTSIPCIFVKSLSGSSKLLLFFHGNAEDLKSSHGLIEIFRSILNINVLAVEYHGYGLYKGRPKSFTILSDAQTIYDFSKSELKFSDTDILIFGRSIGTGPACHIARHNPVCSLLLMSAFTSIKDVVKHFAGRLAKFLVKDRFRNIDLMPFIRCPTFLVHGYKDKMIPFSHSQQLHEQCRGQSALFLPPKMEHNRFDYCDDLVLPIATFLAQSQIELKLQKGQTEVVVDEKFLVPVSKKGVKRDLERIMKEIRGLI